jgi:hypothetical protein
MDEQQIGYDVCELTWEMVLLLSPNQIWQR